MAKPFFHAKSSAHKYGGIWQDYMEIHNLMDSSKAAFSDNRHRALSHNSWFIGHILPLIFGETFERKSDGKIVCTRDIGEQHVLEDYKMRFIPTPTDFLSEMDLKPWMQNAEGAPPASHKKVDDAIIKEDLNITLKSPQPKSKKNTAKNKQLLEQLSLDFVDPVDEKPQVVVSIKETLFDRGNVVFDGRGYNGGRSMTID
jgi:hypothetical protein